MKILAKLLIGFLAVAVLCAVVGYVGMTRMQELSDDLYNMAEVTIPSLNYLNTVAKEFLKIKVANRNLANHKVTEIPAELSKQIGTIDSARTAYRTAYDAFDKLSKVPEEERLWLEVKSKLDAGAAYNNKVVELARETAAIQDPEARARAEQGIFDYTFGENRKTMDELIAALDKVLEFDEEYYGRQRTAKAIQSAKTGITILLGVSVCSFGVAILLGILFGTSVSRSLRKTVSVLDKIAKGDTSERLAVKSKDEFVQVAAALGTVADTLERMVKEAERITEAAVIGRLGERAKSDGLSGSYKDLIAGINDIMEALVSFIDDMPIPAFIIDKEFKVLYMNKAGASLGNASGAELAAARRSCFDFFKTGDCRTERCACSKAMQINAAASSETNAKPLEKTYDIAYTGSPVHDRNGQVVGAFEVIMDQTAIKTAERFTHKNVDFQNREIDGLNVFLGKVADGDLTETYAVAEADEDTKETRARLDSLSQGLNKTVTAINEILTQVRTAAEQVAAGSLQVSQASQTLSQGATEQASSLEEITSSITEISGQTKMNTENAMQTNTLAKTARGNAEQGNIQMKDLVSAMGDINSSAEEISKIVKTIDDISFQINLLALNANVEAARAGKYGKGFAVVAEEVRNLAVRSANSVKETTKMVEGAIANIERGNGLVEVTAKQLDDIVNGSAQVADLSEQAAQASKEQALGLEQVTTGLTQIDQVTQANTASAEESASAAEELSGQAQQLRSMLARFKLRAAESRADNAEVLQMLRNELARQSGHKQEVSPAPVHPKPARAARSTAHPADVISLDDDDFGKF